MQPDAILYDTLSNVIGLQFFKNCRGLSPFGNNVIPKVYFINMFLLFFLMLLSSVLVWTYIVVVLLSYLYKLS